MTSSQIIKKLLLNKYVLFIVGFTVWITFFDRNNLVDKKEARKELEQLKKSRAFYQKKIKEDSLDLMELETNNKQLEKFAREKYMMKKKNEDVFIIVDENGKGIED